MLTLLCLSGPFQLPSSVTFSLALSSFSFTSMVFVLSCLQLHFPFFGSFIFLYHSFPKLSWLNFIFSFIYLLLSQKPCFQSSSIFALLFQKKKKKFYLTSLLSQKQDSQKFLHSIIFSSVYFLPSFYYQVSSFWYLYFSQVPCQFFFVVVVVRYCSSLNEASVQSEVITESVWNLTVVCSIPTLPLICSSFLTWIMWRVCMSEVLGGGISHFPLSTGTKQVVKRAELLVIYLFLML